MDKTKKQILILCTGNSCRSQMAEGFMRKYAGDRAEIYSAGVMTHGVNPKAIEVMKETGIDISHHTSDLMDKYVGNPFDYIITVCDNAKENCPYFPGNATRLHQNFPDPVDATGDKEEILNTYRHTRDLINEYCKDFANQYL